MLLFYLLALSLVNIWIGWQARRLCLSYFSKWLAQRPETLSETVPVVSSGILSSTERIVTIHVYAKGAHTHRRPGCCGNGDIEAEIKESDMNALDQVWCKVAACAKFPLKVTTRLAR